MLGTKFGREIQFGRERVGPRASKLEGSDSFCDVSQFHHPDGTLHNLDGYFQIRAKYAVTGTGVEVTDAGFNQKLGVVVTENQLEDFFSQIP